MNTLCVVLVKCSLDFNTSKSYFSIFEVYFFIDSKKLKIFSFSKHRKSKTNIQEEK